MSKVDHYAILGVARSATAEEIKRAFRDLSRYNHPDRLPTDAPPSVRGEWETRFAKITVAYGILSDADKRKSYDLQPEDADVQDMMNYGVELVEIAATLKGENEDGVDFAGRIAFAAARDVFRMAQSKDGKRRILEFFARVGKPDA